MLALEKLLEARDTPKPFVCKTGLETLRSLFAHVAAGIFRPIQIRKCRRHTLLEISKGLAAFRDDAESEGRRLEASSS